MRRLVLVLAVAAALVAAAVVTLGCRPQGSVVARWSDQTRAAVQGLPDPVASRTWALAWTAADQVRGDDAVAAAVAGVLRELAPQRRRQVDAALQAGCPDAEGAARGSASARRVLRAAEGDGLTAADVDRPFAAPPPAPGVWRPTPPALAPYGGGGLRLARPFFGTSAGVRPPPPVPLGSARYRRDLAEVRLLGERDSTARTPEQTATALFWAPSPVGLYTDVLREVTGDLGTARAVRLLSLFHRVTTDVQIAVATAKAADPRWRPVTALREDGDGDPATPRVPGWTPLVETPPNPEHPSGHAAYAAAAAEVLQRAVGPRTVVVRGRTFTGWQQLVQQNVDGRVWAGVHLRSSDDAGAALGRELARRALGSAAPGL